MKGNKGYSRLQTSAILILDIGAIFFAYALSLWLSPSASAWIRYELVPYSPYFLVISSVWMYQVVDQRLFMSIRVDTLIPQLVSTMKALLGTVLLGTFILALLLGEDLDRMFTLVFLIVTILLVLPLRTGLRLSLWSLRLHGYNYRRILIVGANERAARVVRVLLSHQHFGFNVQGFVDDDPSRKDTLEVTGIPYLGPIQGLEELLTENVVDVVYICLPVRSAYATIQSIAHLCEGVGVPVRLMAELFPFQMTSNDMGRIAGTPILTLSASNVPRSNFNLGHVPDALVAGLLLFMLTPAFFLIGLLIKLDSRGPVFVSESGLRPESGLGKRVLFRIFDTENDADRAASSTPMHAHLAEEIPASIERPLTRVGRFLQRYGLHELPLLVDVVRGADINLAGAARSVSSKPKSDA